MHIDKRQKAHKKYQMLLASHKQNVNPTNNETNFTPIKKKKKKGKKVTQTESKW